jgi:hypothetical protein
MSLSVCAGKNIFYEWSNARGGGGKRETAYRIKYEVDRGYINRKQLTMFSFGADHQSTGI